MPLKTRLRFATLRNIPRLEDGDWKWNQRCQQIARVAPRAAGLPESLFALNGDQLHVKNERLIGTNRPAACSARSISEIGGNIELPLRSHGHELQRLSPTLDHAADLKLGRLAALVGVVELC